MDGWLVGWLALDLGCMQRVVIKFKICTHGEMFGFETGALRHYLRRGIILSKATDTTMKPMP